MNIGDVTIGFLLGAAVGPAAGLYVGIVTGIMMYRSILKESKKHGNDETNG